MFYKKLEEVDSQLAETVDSKLIEEFDFWLATLPQKKKESITASHLSSRLNITLPTAKSLLDYAEGQDILAKYYVVKCSNCGCALRKMTQDELPDIISNIRCDKCGAERFLPLDSVYTTYRIVQNPDVTDEEMLQVIQQRMTVFSQKRNEVSEVLRKAAESFSQRKGWK